MTENIIIAIISAVTTLAGGGFIYAFIAWRKSKSEIKVIDTQGSANIAKALSDAGGFVSTLITSFQAERKDLEDRVNELEAHRDMRSREIYTLQQNFNTLHDQYEKLNRDHAIETQKLRDEVQILQQKVAAGDKKNETYKLVIERLIEALRKVDPQLLEGIELPETLEKIRAVKR